jgi:hypothetical protein
MSLVSALATLKLFCFCNVHQAPKTGGTESNFFHDRYPFFPVDKSPPRLSFVFDCRMYFSRNSLKNLYAIQTSPPGRKYLDGNWQRPKSVMPVKTYIISSIRRGLLYSGRCFFFLNEPEPPPRWSTIRIYGLIETVHNSNELNPAGSSL